MRARAHLKITPLRIAKRIAHATSFRSYAPSLHRLYLSLYRSYPSYYAFNLAARKKWSAYPKTLSSVQEKIAAALKKDGVAITHIEELFDKEVGDYLEKEALIRLASADIQKEIREKEERIGSETIKSDYIVHLFGGYGRENPLFDEHNPFIQFCLHDRVLEIVGTYFGMAPKFKMFSLNSTLLMPKEGKRVFSQNWHRDSNDIRDTKIFLYLNDVDEGTGPFMYVKGSQLGGRWRRFYGKLGEYPDTKELERTIPDEDRITCTGRKGTLVFADTSGLHSGGYSTTRRRLMFTCEFTSPAGLKAPNFSFKQDFELNSFPPLATYALEKY